MLKHFFLLREEVLEFLEEKQAMPTERDLLTVLECTQIEVAGKGVFVADDV